MKILICDDEEKYLNTLKKHIQEYMNNRYITSEITATSEPMSIIKSDATFDLAFLDI